MRARRSVAGRRRAGAAALLAALCVLLLSGAGARERLTVWGTMDVPAMQPVLDAFMAVDPDVTVDYNEHNSIALFRRFLEAAEAGVGLPDLVTSSATDLQAKLVNDGHARAHLSEHADEIPSWAIWRGEAFAFAVEPLVVVFNRAGVPWATPPRTRHALREAIQGNRIRLAGRIGTYDPARSGTGYLSLTQDLEQSPVAWELVRAMGDADVRLFDSSRDIIDRVASGELLVGYNVVGSYAEARAEGDPRIQVLLPEDYTLAVSRIAFIPRLAPRPDLAARFVDFLLSPAGQSTLAGATGTYSVRGDVAGERSMAALERRTFGSIRPVRVGPGLLVYVDRLKRAKVLRRWLDVLGRGGS